MTGATGRRRGRFVPEVVGLEGRRLLSTGGLTRHGAEVAPLAAAGHVGAALPGVPTLFVEPDAGRGPILAAIAAARREIRLGICNLSDPIVGDALAAAAARGVSVRVIIDRADYLAKPPEQAEAASLIARGVQVHLSNPVFPQSFEKYLIIDRRAVMIMTLCIVTPTFEDTRDYGLTVADRRIIAEVGSVFETDWAFSAPPGAPTPPYNPTPPLRVPELIWGPTDATAKLSRLIQSARRTLDVTTELVSDPYLEGQLIAAASRGVRVRLIAPDVARNNASNLDQIAFLNALGVSARVTVGQYPPPGAMPYMHAKTMVVDGRAAYLGSIDLDTTVASQDRELGIVVHRPALVRRLAAQFARDWTRVGPPTT